MTEIASALDVKSSGFSDLLDHVVAHLKHKRLLLILDNCEHVVAEAARVVDAIVQACPRVTVLTTSRERLGSHGEQVYSLPSLAFRHRSRSLNPTMRCGSARLLSLLRAPLQTTRTSP